MDEIRFIEMFCGIGGFRLGLERANKVCEHPELRAGDQEGRRLPLPEGGRSEGGGSGRRFRCIWANDIDKYACRVYRSHYGSDELFEGDVKSVDPDSLPSFDLLTAGIPCQPFSVAGKRKGTDDPRGTLFWEVLRFVHAKRPAVVLIENVKGFLSIGKGRTFADVIHSLGDLGYLVEWQVLNSKYHGVPQNRERVFVIGCLGGVPSRTVFPVEEDAGLPCGAQGEASGEGSRIRGDGPPIVARTLLERYHKDGSDNLIQTPQLGSDGGSCGDMSDISRQVDQIKADGQASSDMSDILRQVGQIVGLGQAGRVYDPTGPAKTIVGCAGGEGAKTGFYAVLANHTASNIKNRRVLPADSEPAWTVGGARTNIAVPKMGQDYANAVDSSGYLREGGHHPEKRVDFANCRIRRLTPKECERLQGFPDNWTEGISDTQRYKCLGNAVTVNVIELIGRRLLDLA